MKRLFVSSDTGVDWVKLGSSNLAIGTSVLDFLQNNFNLDFLLRWMIISIMKQKTDRTNPISHSPRGR